MGETKKGGDATIGAPKRLVGPVETKTNRAWTHDKRRKGTWDKTARHWQRADVVEAWGEAKADWNTPPIQEEWDLRFW